MIKNLIGLITNHELCREANACPVLEKKIKILISSRDIVLIIVVMKTGVGNILTKNNPFQIIIIVTLRNINIKRVASE